MEKKYNYRIYVTGTAGYYNLGTYTSEETLVCLDWLILAQKTQEKILVIEHNISCNIDFPVFIYMGKEKDYEEFKRYISNNEEENKVTYFK